MLKEIAQSLTETTIAEQRYEETIAGKWEKRILNMARQGRNYTWYQINRSGNSELSDEDINYLKSQGLTISVECMDLFDTMLDDTVSCRCHVIRW